MGGRSWKVDGPCWLRGDVYIQYPNPEEGSLHVAELSMKGSIQFSSLCFVLKDIGLHLVSGLGFLCLLESM